MTSRRGLLRLAGLGVVAVAAGCTRDGAAPPGAATPATSPPGTSPTSPPATTTPTVPPGPPDWAALRGRLTGELLLPSDAGY
ncbi:MAG TPA: FAD-binding dehydrogenase, partial [Pseudonocardiaceae bacterium]